MENSAKVLRLRPKTPVRAARDSGGRCLNAITSRSDFSPAVKFVAIALGASANYAQASGFEQWTWSMPLSAIQAFTSYGETTCRDAMNELIARGYAEKRAYRVPGKGRLGNQYRLTAKLFDEYEAVAEAEHQERLAAFNERYPEAPLAPPPEPDRVKPTGRTWVPSDVPAPHLEAPPVGEARGPTGGPNLRCSPRDNKTTSITLESRVDQIDSSSFPPPPPKAVIVLAQLYEKKVWWSSKWSMIEAAEEIVERFGIDPLKKLRELRRGKAKIRDFDRDMLIAVIEQQENGTSQPERQPIVESIAGPSREPEPEPEPAPPPPPPAIPEVPQVPPTIAPAMRSEQDSQADREREQMEAAYRRIEEEARPKREAAARKWQVRWERRSRPDGIVDPQPPTGDAP